MESKLPRMLLLLLVLAALSLARTPGVEAAARKQSSPPDRPGRYPFAPGRVLVKLREEALGALPLSGGPAAERQLLDATVAGLAGAGVAQIAPLLPAALFQIGAQLDQLAIAAGMPRLYRLDLASGQDVQAAALALDPAVEYAEPDYLAFPVAAPDDPLYGNQWSLGSSGIQVEPAWSVTPGAVAIVIAVVDLGLDLTHPDLAPNLWVNPGGVPGNGKDDDLDGFVDDVRGWNFTAANGGNNNVQDDTAGNGHGTEVAGIAAARTNSCLAIPASMPLRPPPESIKLDPSCVAVRLRARRTAFSAPGRPPTCRTWPVMAASHVPWAVPISGYLISRSRAM